MSLAHVIRILSMMFIAGLITWLTYSVEIEGATQDQIALGLKMARQIAAQAQELSLYAQSHEEPDPISWAVRFLTVGPESRAIHFTPIKSGILANNTESYEFKIEKGDFTYSKILFPDTGKGIKIEIDLGYLGFLGTHQPWKNDLFFFVLFLLLYVFLNSLGTKKENKNENRSDISEYLLTWTDEAKSTFLQLGGHLKLLIQKTQILTTSAANCRAALKRVKDSQRRPSLEVESAFHSYDEFFKVTQEMNDCIAQTTQTLLHEGKMLQDLKANASSLEKPQKKLNSIK